MRSPNESHAPTGTEGAALEDVVSPRKLSGSVGTKVALIAAIIVMISLSVMVTVNTISERNNLVAQGEKSFAEITKLLAANVAGGVKWKKTAVIEEAYADLANDPESAIANIRTFDGADQPLTSFDSTVHPSADLGEALQQSLQASDSGGLYLSRTGDHVLVALPAGFAKDGKRTGTLAVAWSLKEVNDQVAAALVRQLGTATATILFLLFLLVVVANRMVGRPLSQLSDTVSNLRDDKTDVDILGTQRGDEIGSLARSMAVWRKGIMERKKLEHAQTRARGAGTFAGVERKSRRAQRAVDP